MTTIESLKQWRANEYVTAAAFEYLAALYFKNVKHDYPGQFLSLSLHHSSSVSLSLHLSLDLDLDLSLDLRIDLGHQTPAKSSSS
jgi:hypothetical protein